MDATTLRRVMMVVATTAAFASSACFEVGGRQWDNPFDPNGPQHIDCDAERRCGVINGRDCGKCKGTREICGAKNICIDACDNNKCGALPSGQMCGKCTDASKACIANECQEPCKDRCGTVAGTKCDACKVAGQVCSQDNKCVKFPGTWETVSSGSFTMGAPSTEPCSGRKDYPAETSHRVTLTNTFEVTQSEVTQGQFSELMGYNPSKALNDAQFPVETVSWHEGAAYCNALSAAKSLTACYTCTGSKASASCKSATAFAGANIYKCRGYRLPTEAEYEYAYRAGTTTAYFTGISDKDTCITCDRVNAVAEKAGWYKCNAFSEVKRVAEKGANLWKLRDMAGNVREWTHDPLQNDLGSGAATDPVGSGDATVRAIRGGGFKDEANALRAAARERSSASSATSRANDLGFRCARSK